jgi:hypothetical protein
MSGKNIFLNGIWHLSGRREMSHAVPAERLEQADFCLTDATVPGNIESELQTTEPRVQKKENFGGDHQ